MRHLPPGFLGMQEIVPLVVGLIRIVHIVLGPFPVVANHFVEHFALSPVAEDMGTQTFQDVVGLFPKILGPARSRPYPQATVQAHEPFHHRFTRSALAVSHVELRDAAALLQCYWCQLQKWPGVTVHDRRCDEGPEELQAASGHSGRCCECMACLCAQERR